MTTYGQHDHQATTTYHDPPEESERFPFPAPRAHAEPDEPTPDGPLYSHEQQYERFGGTNWGAGFFGAVVTATLGVALGGAVAAVAVFLGATPETLRSSATDSPQAVLIGAVAVLLGVLVAACYAGGYVAGRMSRFDGGRQGFASWLLAAALATVTGGFGLLAVGGAGLVDLPGLGDLPQPGGSPLAWAAGSAAVLLLGSLGAAVAGGKVGRQYHQKVDDAGYL